MTRDRRLCILFATLMVALVAASVVRSSYARELVVGAGAPYTSLRAALEAAGDGDRVIVRRGVYRDSTLQIDRSISISGEDGAVLEGALGQSILTVTAEGVEIRGLVFRNVLVSFVEDRAAIKVDGGTGCRIVDNRFEDTFFAIYLARSSGCTIENNTIVGAGGRESQSGNGIHLWYSRDAVVRDNRITGHRDGIYLEFVEDTHVSGNRSEGNLRYGLHFMFSDGCGYVRNHFSGNDAGVAVMYSRAVEMRGNRFEGNLGSAAYGLLLKEISDSQITENRFESNTVGMYVEGSNRMTVENNDFVGNGWAIKIMANAEDNRFSRNGFFRNTFDVSTNSRQSFSTFTGNYWDRYRGYDLDEDGTGDVPFRPVRLFSLMVERNEPALILLRSPFVTLLDAAEAVVPALTPETLVDDAPLMRRRS